VLLGGAALYTEARQLALIQIQPYKTVVLTQAIQNAMQCSRAARAKRAINVHRAITICNTPPANRTSISTD
jgi:hypothetical protein